MIVVSEQRLQSVLDAFEFTMGDYGEVRAFFLPRALILILLAKGQKEK